MSCPAGLSTGRARRLCWITRVRATSSAWSGLIARGRSLKELLVTVEGFKARGLGFRSLEERLDTVSAAGELVFHVFGAIAHFERRLIVERTRDGVAAARERGKRPGRPPLNDEKLQAALTLIRSGLSPSSAARQVGLGRSTLYREIALLPGAAYITALP